MPTESNKPSPPILGPAVGFNLLVDVGEIHGQAEPSSAAVSLLDPTAEVVSVVMTNVCSPVPPYPLVVEAVPRG